MMAVRAWEASAELVPLEVSNSFNLPEGSYDLLCIVPSMIPNLLNHPAWAGRVRNVLIGGSAPASEALMALVDSGYDIHVSYGMTETCSHIALAGIERIYEAMPGVNFSIDERGCLVIKAPGYSWGILTTNDVVELIDDCHFRWRGRIDNVINSGGIKLFPEELERLYAPFINAPFAVTSRPSVKWGEEIVLVIAADTVPAFPSTILRTHLPKAIVRVESLPLTENGKIDRKHLKEVHIKP